MKDGEAVQVHGPRVILEWPSEGSSRPTLTIEGVDYMQLFSAAKLLEIMGEETYARARMEEAAVQARKDLVDPKNRIDIPGRQGPRPLS